MSEYMETCYLEFTPTGMAFGYLPHLIPRGAAYATWASGGPLPLKYIPINRFYIYPDLLEIHSPYCVTSFAETQTHFVIRSERGEFKLIAPAFQYVPHSYYGTKFRIACENMFTRTMIGI
jgi:hypothetical protein